MLQMKRVYETVQAQDGYRILVDRLWPRGESKEKAGIDLWAKDIAPSAQIRMEFGHEPDRFPWFRGQYLLQLQKNPYTSDFIKIVREKCKDGNVTLVYAAKDREHNHVVVLKSFLEERLKSQT